jgi:hypothetical protein
MDDHTGDDENEPFRHGSGEGLTTSSTESRTGSDLHTQLSSDTLQSLATQLLEQIKLDLKDSLNEEPELESPASQHLSVDQLVQGSRKRRKRSQRRKSKKSSVSVTHQQASEKH